MSLIRTRSTHSLVAICFALFASPLMASSLEVKGEKLELKVEVPRLKVSEYHRPYVAIWVQDQKGNAVVNLAVWYQVKGPSDDFGAKWLPDLRQWWRRSGRELELPIDGVTGPTRPAGVHTLDFGTEQLKKLSAGKYTLAVEAAREVGGREILEIPFVWPGEKAMVYQVEGKKELGKIVLTIKP